MDQLLNININKTNLMTDKWEEDHNLNGSFSSLNKMWNRPPDGE